jgi:BCD family chlorophyll transporter-like MFS transporter
VQNGGVLLGMIATAVIGTTVGKSRAGFMRLWAVGGCAASAIALAALATGAAVGPAWPLKPSVFGLGLANGAFAVAAIGSMMTLASVGQKNREGMRMGLWGASQAIAFGLGGFLGAAAIDVARAILADPATAFAIVFAVEGGMFLAAAYLAAWVGRTEADDMTLPAMPAGEHLRAE